jgi:hypothetical protein
MEVGTDLERFRRVGYDSHSVQVERIRERLLALLADIRPRSVDTPFLGLFDEVVRNRSLCPRGDPGESSQGFVNPPARAAQQRHNDAMPSLSSCLPMGVACYEADR